jgi:hypothetical protein
MLLIKTGNRYFFLLLLYKKYKKEHIIKKSGIIAPNILSTFCARKKIKKGDTIQGATYTISLSKKIHENIHITTAKIPRVRGIIPHTVTKTISR